MSRAFTKEIDDAPAERIQRLGVPVPDLNFVTPAGLAAAKAELEQLVRSGGDLDRIRELSDHLATAQALEPTDRDVVGIGASVTVEDGHGKRTTYRIVGAIEADPKQRALGWQSPLAQALWGARVGDTCVLPRGDEVEVVEITY
ncbi:MAG: GreA/GreB family elongation factor [Deltaproteobacteria bacterium]|nr:GreA/GreB family elongation factor [Deltaproteobacteria bacterium]